MGLDAFEVNGCGCLDAAQERQQHLVLRHRGLSDGRHRQILPGPCQPHQDSASPRTGEVRGHFRQRKPEIFLNLCLEMSEIMAKFATIQNYKPNKT